MGNDSSIYKKLQEIEEEEAYDSLNDFIHSLDSNLLQADERVLLAKLFVKKQKLS